MSDSIAGIPAIVFDLGNTLLPYGDAEARLLAEKLFELSGASEDGIDRPSFLECYRDMVELETSLREGTCWESDPAWRAQVICQNLSGLGFGPDTLEERIASAHPRAFSSCLRFPDRTIEVLEELRSMGARLALVSNAMDGKGVRIAMEEYGADRFLDPVVISEEEGVAKPDPRIFLKAVSGLGLAPSQCAYVGDRYVVDVLGSRRAGMVPVYTREYATEGEPPDGIEATTTVRGLDEVIRLWEG